MPSFEEFVSEMDQLVSSTLFFVVCSKASNQALGFVYSYNSSSIDGFSFFSLYVDGVARKAGIGAEAGLLFLDYMFTYFPTRKAYAEVYEFNQLSLKTLRNGGFRVEGIFRDHIWYGDRYWALFRLTLDRDRWVTLRSRMQRFFSAYDGVAEGELRDSIADQAWEVRIASENGALLPNVHRNAH